MSIYVDSSALVKRYLFETGYEDVDALFASESKVTTSALSVVEVRRVLAQIGSAVERIGAKLVFEHDLEGLDRVELDGRVIDQAAAIAEATGLRSLDAIHLGAALVAGCRRLASFDVRQRRVAEQFGLELYPATAG